MEIEPMTFRTLVGRSTTEPRELIWRARSQYWVMIHGLYHTITERHQSFSDSVSLILYLLFMSFFLRGMQSDSKYNNMLVGSLSSILQQLQCYYCCCFFMLFMQVIVVALMLLIVAVAFVNYCLFQVLMLLTAVSVFNVVNFYCLFC